MALKEYKRKRDFTRTSEPRGRAKRPKKQLIFVVQKHDASRLHYDLRLEMGGVLKSWAVPKGPSLDPHVKRLAIEVEDHPYEYKDFEGEIPEGECGAGHVIIWDNGLYSPMPMTDDPDEEAQRQYRAGRLTIVLLGKRLRGEFGLIRTNREDKGGRKKQWLLVKAGDRYASAKEVTEKTTSVISGKKLPRDRKKK